MERDPIRRFLNQGTLSYVLVKAGLFRVRDTVDPLELSATELLQSWFPAGMPDLLILADALDAFVLSYAYEVSGFLDGERGVAMNSLTSLGMSVQAIPILRVKIIEGAKIVKKELAAAALLYR